MTGAEKNSGIRCNRSGSHRVHVGESLAARQTGESVHLVQGLRVCMLLVLLVLAACGTGNAGTPTAQRQPEAGSIRGTDPAPAHTPSEPPPEIPAETPSDEGPTGPTPSPKESTDRPNIVLVLMDDFSRDLLPTMRSAARMQRQGASYSHSFVVDSLCCVSRSALFTGQYPRQNGVLTNVSGEIPGEPYGGFTAFEEYGNPQRSFNVRLQRSGYTTGFVGKYLNEYELKPRKPIPPVMPGWSSFVPVFGSAYDQWGFWNGRLSAGADDLLAEQHPRPPSYLSREAIDAEYADRFVADEALSFIRDHRGDSAPYFLEVATYATHARTSDEGAFPGDPIFPPMKRDQQRPGNPQGNCGPVRCGSLRAQELPGYGDDSRDNVPLNRAGEPAGSWRGFASAQRPKAHTKLLRDRARMTQHLDRMVQRILDEVGPDTYVVLTSDNGFHLGQNGMDFGKGTPYDTDARVPLLVVGPGVVPGQRPQLTSNIDLAPTFEDLAGLRSPRYRSGHSFADTFGNPRAPSRKAVFFEHMGQASTAHDPDAALLGRGINRIPSYVAVRTRDSLLMRLDLDPDPLAERTAWEFYSYRDAGWERTNSYADPRHRDEVRRMTGMLRRWDRCRARGDDPVTKRCRRLGAATTTR